MKKELSKEDLKKVTGGAMAHGKDNDGKKHGGKRHSHAGYTTDVPKKVGPRPMA